MMIPMVEPIDYDEIKKTFAPILEEIPKLLQKLKFCLKSELSQFDHNFSRTSSEQQHIREIMHFVQKKWKLDIAYLLLVHNHLFFNQLKDLLPNISNNILSQRLKELEKENLIIRSEIGAVSPIRVSYQLTLFGQNFILLLIPSFLFYLVKKN